MNRKMNKYLQTLIDTVNKMPCTGSNIHTRGNVLGLLMGAMHTDNFELKQRCGRRAMELIVEMVSTQHQYKRAA